MSNELGLRNVCFEIDDLRGTVDRLSSEGYGLVAYVRGPEGIIVSLAESIGAT